MPGIIESARETPLASTQDLEPDAAAAANTTTGYDPERIEVDESQDTVQGRISGVIAANSPLMQAAGTRAKQAANRRGVLNSTMAIGAGEKAVLDTALPIAQQDAQTYFAARGANAAAGNAALSQTAGARQAQELQDQGGIISSRLQTEQGDIQTGHLETQGDIQSDLQAEAGVIQSDLAAQEGEIQTGLIGTQSAAQINEMIASGEINAGLLEQEYGLKTALENERAQIELELMDADAANRGELIDRQGVIDAQLTDQRVQGQLEITDLENEWRSLLQASASATAIFQTTAEQIGSILANPDISVPNKTALVNQLKTQLSDGLNVIGGIADLDLDAFLGFDSQGGGTVNVDDDGNWTDNEGNIVVPNPGDIGSWLQGIADSFV